MSWLNYFPCGIEIYGKEVQDICKMKNNVTTNSLALSNINQLYQKGYIENFTNLYYKKNQINKFKYLIIFLFIIIIFFLLYNIK